MAIFKGLMWNIHNSHFYLFKFDHPNKKNLKKKKKKKEETKTDPPPKKNKHKTQLVTAHFSQ